MGGDNCFGGSWNKWWVLVREFLGLCYLKAKETTECKKALLLELGPSKLFKALFLLCVCVCVFLSGNLKN